jgi:lipoate-protein ligase A
VRPIWRLLDTGALGAAENMALDDTVLECRSAGEVPNTIRLLQFKPPAVLVGYHQVVEQEVRLDYCKRVGIEINRRLTGGGAIYLDEGVMGWEIFASKEDLPDVQIEKACEKLSRGAVLGLRRLGVEASFRGRNDIEVNGRKISGMGGTERGGAFLFQGTLLIDFNVETMLRALRVPIAKLRDKEVRSLRRRVTCLKWELDSTPSLSEVKGALAEGFEEALGIKLQEAGLTSREEELFKERIDYFRSDEWIYAVRGPPSGVGEVYALLKRSGGLVRASISVDKEMRIIKSVFITGDFFAYPSRAILDLEALLKDSQISDAPSIIQDFFRRHKVEIPGLDPGDFAEVVMRALEKLDFERLGLTTDEANSIHTVAGRAEDILKNGCDYLLLPYCAKLATCEYRWREGCARCGMCSVGSAYEMAEKADLKVLTIQNFESLMRALGELRRRGVRGYIGCCCEAFIQKHQEDLERAGVPALLVDLNSETCYDLGKEEEAYRGGFEGQTELKLEILSKLLTQAARGGEDLEV